MFGLLGSWLRGGFDWLTWAFVALVLVYSGLLVFDRLKERRERRSNDTPNP